MAHHHLMGTPSFALGGIEYQFLAAFTAAVPRIARLRRVFICFDSDVAAATMRLRLDGIPDAVFRGLQLACSFSLAAGWTSRGCPDCEARRRRSTSMICSR